MTAEWEKLGEYINPRRKPLIHNFLKTVYDFNSLQKLEIKFLVWKWSEIDKSSKFVQIDKKLVYLTGWYILVEWMNLME